MTHENLFLRGLGDLVALVLRHRSRPRVAFTRVQIGRLSITGDLQMLLLTNGQKVTLSIAPLDAFGQAARIDGLPAWNVSDGALATITPAEDGMSAVLEPLGPVGLLQVQVTADADLGEGIKSLSGTLDVQVEAGEAVTLGITAGVPEPK